MLAETLKKLRLNRNLTMDEVVLDINGKYNTRLNKSTLSNWENKKFIPSNKYLKIISEYYGVSLKYFIKLRELERG